MNVVDMIRCSLGRHVWRYLFDTHARYRECARCGEKRYPRHWDVSGIGKKDDDPYLEVCKRMAKEFPVTARWLYEQSERIVFKVDVDKYEDLMRRAVPITRTDYPLSLLLKDYYCAESIDCK